MKVKLLVFLTLLVSLQTFAADRCGSKAVAVAKQYAASTSTSKFWSIMSLPDPNNKSVAYLVTFADKAIEATSFESYEIALLKAGCVPVEVKTYRF